MAPEITKENTFIVVKSGNFVIPGQNKNVNLPQYGNFFSNNSASNLYVKKKVDHMVRNNSSVLDDKFAS